ncbi:MAG: AI-2E family transporter, partial [Bdellovibrionales bacterium]|nr:AI-2E family transporter [Bdellovibrionales bacterium]
MSISILFILLASALVTVFFFGLGSALVPLVLSFVLAFFLFPLVIRLEKWGLGRTWSTIVVFLGATLLFILAFVFTIPPFIREARFFLNELPVNLQKVITNIEALGAEYGIILDLNKEQIIQLIKKYSSTVSLELVQGVGVFFKEAFTELTGLFLFILNLFLFPVFFY